MFCSSEVNFQPKQQNFSETGQRLFKRTHESDVNNWKGATHCSAVHPYVCDILLRSLFRQQFILKIKLFYLSNVVFTIWLSFNNLVDQFIILFILVILYMFALQ